MSNRHSVGPLRTAGSGVWKAIKKAQQDIALREELGVGAYGRVYRGEERATGAACAVKVIDVTAGEESRTEARQEVAAMRSVPKHAHIVDFYGAYDVGKSEIWIVMEYAEIGSCLDLMRILNNGLDDVLICAVLRQTLSGLFFLHSQSLLHRDIKAGNLLLHRNGIVKICDFGLATKVEESQKVTSAIGSPYWMAPEVIKEVGYSFAADIWSLGITIIELAEMVPPRSEIHPLKVIFEIPGKRAPVFEEPEAHSAHLNDLVAQCLQKKPARRPTARQLLQHALFTSSAKTLERARLSEVTRRAQERISECGGRALAMEHADDALDPSEKALKDAVRTLSGLTLKRAHSRSSSRSELADEVAWQSQAKLVRTNSVLFTPSQLQSITAVSPEMLQKPRRISLHASREEMSRRRDISANLSLQTIRLKKTAKGQIEATAIRTKKAAKKVASSPASPASTTSTGDGNNESAGAASANKALEELKRSVHKLARSVKSIIAKLTSGDMGRAVALDRLDTLTKRLRKLLDECDFNYKRDAACHHQVRRFHKLKKRAIALADVLEKTDGSSNSSSADKDSQSSASSAAGKTRVKVRRKKSRRDSAVLPRPSSGNNARQVQRGRSATERSPRQRKQRASPLSHEVDSSSDERQQRGSRSPRRTHRASVPQIALTESGESEGTAQRKSSQRRRRKTSRKPGSQTSRHSSTQPTLGVQRSQNNGRRSSLPGFDASSANLESASGQRSKSRSARNRRKPSKSTHGRPVAAVAGDDIFNEPKSAASKSHKAKGKSSSTKKKAKDGVKEGDKLIRKTVASRTAVKEEVSGKECAYCKWKVPPGVPMQFCGACGTSLLT